MRNLCDETSGVVSEVGVHLVMKQLSDPTTFSCPAAERKMWVGVVRPDALLRKVAVVLHLPQALRAFTEGGNELGFLKAPGEPTVDCLEDIVFLTPGRVWETGIGKGNRTGATFLMEDITLLREPGDQW
jgi:hypothetical protein